MDFEIYCDESRQEVLSNKNAHSYMAIGGIWTPAFKREDLKFNLKKIKAYHNIYGEFKWNKVSPAYINFYTDILNYFFNNDEIRFRCIVIESDKIDHVQFNENDQELGFYKFYYQLIHHWILDFNNYNIFVDYKLIRDRTRLHVLKDILRKSNITSSIDRVQALPSQESLGIQLADLLTGIVSAKFNRQTQSTTKWELIHFTENSKPIRPTNKAEEKFNIFKIKLQGGW